MIFMVMGCIQKLYQKYMKENFNTIIQGIINSSNVI